MFRFLGKVLAPDEFESLEDAILKDAKADEMMSAWEKLQSLRQVQAHQCEAAWCLLRIADQGLFDREDMADVLLEIAQAHGETPDLMCSLGECLEALRDIDDLNAPASEHDLFDTVVERLSALAKTHRGSEDEEAILSALATSARMHGRQCDEIAETSYRQLVELKPSDASHHYNLGLFYKTRGFFEKGMECNQKARDLAAQQDEAHIWNLGICATGAGAGEVALGVWKGINQIIEMGRFGLPDGSYPQCKVRLAEKPLAERSAETDDPGLEETIWIERLSPCHGIIRSVLYYDLGVNYGDVVMIDGAPITYHTYGEEEVPVFPHLATLVRRGYQIYPFAGTQEQARQLADVSVDLDADAIVYSHTEQFRELCESCWRDPNVDHEHHKVAEKHVVTGRIAAPPDVDPQTLLARIDDAVIARTPCRLYAPDLCLAAGQEDRARIDQRRFDLLMAN